MTSIIYIGMDVHTTNYTLCSYTIEQDTPFAQVQVEPDYHNILKYLERVRKNFGEDCRFLCGYEAGCLGYTLYHQLTSHHIDCVILAPSSMPARKRNEVKTDKRDAEKISRCLAYHTYNPVYIPDAEDNAVKEYIRMRDSHKATLKRTKQQIIFFCIRNGKQFDRKSYWTKKHLDWLNELSFSDPILRETLDEYILLYYQAVNKVSTFDKRIEELSHQERFAEKAKKLGCFVGISTHTSMALIAETGDFHRFATAQSYASFLGLVPGEQSSGDKQRRTGITKKGNSHLRWLLVEAAQCYGRKSSGKKSKALLARQDGNSPADIAYADRAIERLRRKFYRIALRSSRNVAVTAVARELACFVWGMMTGNTQQVLNC